MRRHTHMHIHICIYITLHYLKYIHICIYIYIYERGPTGRARTPCGEALDRSPGAREARWTRPEATATATATASF